MSLGDTLTAEAKAADGPRKPKRRGMDPLTRKLVLASGVLVVLVLALTAAIVYFASAGITVPRTRAERDLMVARQKTQSTPKDPNAWIDLAAACIGAERFDEADVAIDVLEKLTKQSIVNLLRGDMAYAKGDVSGARSEYQKALKQADVDRQALITKAAGRGMPATSVQPSRQAVSAHIALARLDTEAGDHDAAIKHLQAALKLDPNAADVLTALGNAQAADGDNKGAEASYRRALTFISDYEPALTGLERLRGGR